MKKIIDGKRYDTETAEWLCDISQPYISRNDTTFDNTNLYRSPKGQYFVSGEGGARSCWAKPHGENGRGPGRGLRLIEETEARRLFELHGDQERYAEVFGEPEEG